MKDKISIIILTLIIMGLVTYFSHNYYYQPVLLFIVLCLYFVFVIFSIQSKYPYQWILFTVTGFYVLITVIGLLTGNVSTTRLPDNFFTLFIIFLLPYTLALAFSKQRRWKFAVVLIFVVSNYFSSYYYFYFNDNKSHFATYNGSYNYQLKNELIFSTSAGDAKKLQSGKIYVVDMWNKGCGVCLIKFPKVNSLKKKYESDSDIEFIALNIYQSEDEIISSQKRFNRENLDFPTYYLAQENAAELKPEFFPITLVIKDNKIIFRGSVETLNALDFLYLR